MDSPTTQRGGLRERKKQATRAALSWAAVRLVVERGLDNVLVEDIAAAAGVSPRTFNNYFSSKAEAVTARHVDRMRGLAGVLRDRPPDEPVWESVTHAALSQFSAGEGTTGAGTDPEWIAGVRLMVTEPALQGELIKAHAATEGELIAAIAARTRTDPDRDLYPRLLAAAVGAAIQTATAQWLNIHPPVPLETLLREALAQLAAGLPPPTHR